MSTFEDEYDSDAEYVPDFDMVDLSDFQLTDGGELVGGSWGAMVEHCKDDDVTFQFAMPIFKVGNSLDITEASKNGFLKLKLEDNDAKHVEFMQWIANLESWLVEEFVKNHNKWFGHMWQKGGPLEGRPLPPAAAIKEMYHPIIGDDKIFCSRVHITKGTYDVQCMDSEQNMIDFSKIVNCNVVPLVELKGIFMKPRGYNPDIVLRGLVIVPDEDNSEQSRNDQYCLFHTPENVEQYAYYDYATDDETASEAGDDIDETELDEIISKENEEGTPSTEGVQESVSENIETQPQLEESTKQVEISTPDEVASPAEVVTPVEVSENATPSDVSSEVPSQSNTSEPNEETIKELMRATENAKKAAKEAEDLYQTYMNKHNSTTTN